MDGETRSVEVAVVGGGPAGLTAAVALAAAGIETALISKTPPPDNRTTALWSASVAAMEALEVWPLCRDNSAPLTAIRLIDDTRRLIRAPEVTFEAREIGLAAFGHNIANRHLIAALDQRAAGLPSLRRIEAAVTAVEPDDTGVTIRLDNGAAIEARLVVGADGRKSLCRQAAAIGTDRRDYPQAALTLNLAHARPHNGISTEFHTESGPFTLVPLPGLRSSLVCVTEPDEAEQLAALEAVALSAEIERRAHSILGKMEVEDGRSLFPIGVETARSLAARRIALTGEAAHVIPPIGAQGLNLGLRDAFELVRALARNADVDAVLRRLEWQRAPDRWGMIIATDFLARSFTWKLPGAGAARGLGIAALQALGPVKSAIARQMMFGSR